MMAAVVSLQQKWGAATATFLRGDGEQLERKGVEDFQRLEDVEVRSCAATAVGGRSVGPSVGLSRRKPSVFAFFPGDEGGWGCLFPSVPPSKSGEKFHNTASDAHHRRVLSFICHGYNAELEKKEWEKWSRRHPTHTLPVEKESSS